MNESKFLNVSNSNIHTSRTIRLDMPIPSAEMGSGISIELIATDKNHIQFQDLVVKPNSSLLLKSDQEDSEGSTTEIRFTGTTTHFYPGSYFDLTQLN